MYWEEWAYKMDTFFTAVSFTNNIEKMINNMISS